FSGIHLLLDRPFKIGDLIFLEGGEYCRVENVGMRSTKLYSIFDHELIILPNNTVANQKIINIVKPDNRIRKKIEVGVAYGSDLEKVKYIMYQSAKEHEHVVDEPGYDPQVRFVGFGESSLDFLMYVWIDEVLNQWKVLSDIRLQIDARFRKEQVTIPFPQRTVWLNHVKKESKKAEQVKKEVSLAKENKNSDETEGNQKD
ncbi:MAG: mechanosensitive ion channel, partial [Thermoplasmatota archaeon]